MCVMAALMGYQLRQLWSITQGCKLPGFSLVSQVNVSANSNREPTLGAETVRKNKTQEWLPENFLQPVDEEEVATKVPAPFYCDPFEHVLVINLEDDRGIGRRKHMMQQFKKAGIKKYNFFPAVDFKEDQKGLAIEERIETYSWPLSKSSALSSYFGLCHESSQSL
eukprot:symbB.v1.2.029585.t1/scaffold3259.1/size60087/2